MNSRPPRWRLSLAGGFALLAIAVTGAARAQTPEVTAVRFPVVFFPPPPPVYGAAVPAEPTGTPWLFQGRRLLPPGGLGDFVGEGFYPPLSTRLFAGALSRSLEARIGEYRARRNGLVNELLDQFVLLHDAAEGERERALREFAAAQTPRIAALETSAEALRHDLVWSGLTGGVDWNAQRTWTLDSFPPSREWANREAEFQVVRAAAFFEDGLVPAQRGLLRELAADLAAIARKSRGEPGNRADSDAMYFSPETTRLRLPPDLPPALLHRIGAFNAQRQTLKQQLRTLLHEQEGAPRSQRAAAYARLAEEQWPHLGNLETLAEEIRRELAPRFQPVAPARPPAIPAWLVQFIESYNEDRDSYFGDLRHAVQEAVNGVRRPPRLADRDEQARVDEDYDRLRREVQRRTIEDFQALHAARFAGLEARYRAIRQALETIASTLVEPRTGRPLNVDTLLRQHVAALEEFERFGRASAIYGPYRLAMLQPGLSPEQRRLLLGHALAGLAQPLPFGEPLPRRSARVPLPH